MANVYCITFGLSNIKPDDVSGKRVLEVGARDVNGSMRPVLESWGAGEYVGADIEAGPGVDIICRVEDLCGRFGEESFDVVIGYELLEHVADWRASISNIKRVCRQGGLVVIATRSYGFPYHGYPHDFWRFEIGDFESIFSDFEAVKLAKDMEIEGVCFIGRKPASFTERDLSGHKLYSIMENKRILTHSQGDIDSFNSAYAGINFIKRSAASLARLAMKSARVVIPSKYRRNGALWRI